MEHQRRSSVEGSRGILSCKMFKIEVLVNGISGNLRPSQCVIMSYFFCNVKVQPSPQPPLDPSLHTVLFTIVP